MCGVQLTWVRILGLSIPFALPSKPQPSCKGCYRPHKVVTVINEMVYLKFSGYSNLTIKGTHWWYYFEFVKLTCSLEVTSKCQSQRVRKDEAEEWTQVLKRERK